MSDAKSRLRELCADIKKVRTDSGMTQRSLSEDTRLSIPVIREIETNPSWHMQAVTVFRYFRGIGEDPAPYFDALRRVWESTMSE